MYETTTEGKTEVSKFAQALSVETAQPGPQCKTGTLLKRLPKDEAADLTAALADLNIAGSMISRALAKVGNPINAQSVVRHRKGECNCPKPGQ